MRFCIIFILMLRSVMSFHPTFHPTPSLFLSTSLLNSIPQSFNKADRALIKARCLRVRNLSTAASEIPLLAIKVNTCPALRKSMDLTNREKRGRLFIPLTPVPTLPALKLHVHEFFRALKANSYLLFTSLPDTPTTLTPLESSADVTTAFLEASNSFNDSTAPPSSSSLTRPTLFLYVSADPDAPPPPAPPTYLNDLPDPLSSPSITMLSFYSFPPDPIADPDAFSAALKKAFLPLHVQGRIYVAPEGVNAQISVPTTFLPFFSAACKTLAPLSSMENGLNLDPVPIPTATYNADPPFSNLHIRPRAQIVADGLDPSSPLDWQSAGYDMPPLEWHDALAQPPSSSSPVLLDCRNSYETGVGSFVDAEPLNTESFRDTWDALELRLKDTPKDAPIMTYCTGGIRCVKVGAYLTQKMGYTNVSRLAGGIVAYDRTLGESSNASRPIESLFHGSNYVFDNRVGRQITDHKLGTCVTCGGKTNLLTNCANNGCHKRMVQCETCAPTFAGCCSSGCRSIFVSRPPPPTQTFDPAVFDDVQEYCASHSSPAPDQFANFRVLKEGAHMVSSGVQGRLLTTLASMTRSGRVLEIGTFTGYATCW